jgi:phospholipase D-like protein
MAKKKWSDLSPFQQRLIYVGGAAETVVTVAALRDLATRPSAQVRGPKAVWVLSFVVQPLGPLAYFAVGRR